MLCQDCTHWIKRRVCRYGDGTEIETYRAPEDQGHCNVLGQHTNRDFGCNRFSPAHPSDHTEVIEKEGAQWQNWHMDICPECGGRGSLMVEMRPACRRCSGTGKVRHYDDGYIADASWDHPKEKELKKKLGIWGKSDPGLKLAPVTLDDKENAGLFEDLS